MSLAARCPACGTVFRVVQDQLRVSEGWVRCGRCAEVFNAIESLVDLEADAAARPGARAERSDRVLEDLARVGGVDIDLAPDEATAAAPAKPQGAAGELAMPSAAAAPAAEPHDEESTPPGGDAPPVLTAAPEFVRRADRAARWRRPGVRIALGLAGIAAVALLAGQVALEYRDTMAAQWPATRPALEQLCAAFDCRVGAPRAIDGLAVESSGLVRIEGSPNYRLSVVLRNRTAFAIAAPAIDLTLTDSQGLVIARRVLRAAELGATQESLAARSDLSMQASLAATDRPVSGYTIEIFYP